MKREAELKSAFMRELKKQLPHFLVLQYSTAGAPDREIIGNGVSTRWEMKHATPDFLSPGNQELCCMRLAAQGHCRYVLWWEAGGEDQRTMIVAPKVINARNHGSSSWTSIYCESFIRGFDHVWLVNQVKKAHGL